MSKPKQHKSALCAVRGGLLGVSSAALAVTAHVVGDGELPDTAMTLLLTVLIGWNAAALAAKARGPLATIIDLGAGQIVMHLVLSSLSSHELARSTPAAPESSGFAMTVAHVVATLITAVLLAKADGLLLGVLSCLRALVPFLLAALPVPAAVPAPVFTRPADPGHLVRVDLRRVHGRRGPPLCS